MKREASDFYEAVEDLYALLTKVADKDELEASRDDVRRFVHRVSETYLNWAFEVDRAELGQ